MRVGVLGGGQLARMLVLAGNNLGLSFRVYDSALRSSTAELAPCVVGEFRDEKALEEYAKEVDVVTTEFENIPAEVYEYLSKFVPCHPSPSAIGLLQDRLSEKQIFDELSIPTSPFLPVDTRESLAAAGEKLGYPLVVKRRRFGYDGKGQWRVKNSDAVSTVWAEIDGAACIAEAFVPFSRELSLITVCGLGGERKFYPLVENVHDNKILDTSVAPATNLSDSLQNLAEQHATRLADKLNYVGVFVLEFFESDGVLIANECAPRVHNSGHWTIEGAEVSQFENHVRAVSGLPLGSTKPRGVSMMKNFIGVMPSLDDLLADDRLHVHDYMKEPKPGRKLGHATVVTETHDQLQAVEIPVGKR